MGKILVLEDESELREVLSSLLEDEGYQVVTAENGSAAVELAAQQSFDLIITDIRMDGLDGLAALEQARRLQPSLSSLVVSGYTSEAETLRALQLNVGGFLKKPFALADLLQSVRDLLGHHRKQMALLNTVGQLRQSLWWALETGATALYPAAEEAGRMAFHLASQLGWEDDEAYRCRLAAMIFTLPEGPFHELPPSASSDLQGLGPVHALLGELRRASPLSLAAQVVTAAHHLATQETPLDLEIPWAPALLALLQAEGPEIVNSPRILASQVHQEQALGIAGSASIHRSLLGLAATLEERGDFLAARQAYHKLEQDPSATAENRLRALVGRARTLFFSGEPGYYEALKEAERCSRTLGPLAGATQRWSIASLLFRSGHASAHSYLLQLETELRQVGSLGAWARARVARGQLSGPGEGLEEAIRLLTNPSNLGEVVAEASWLAPALLNLAPQIDFPRGPWACRLACEFPGAVTRYLMTLQGDSPGAALLLEALELHPELVPVSFLASVEQHPDAKLRSRVLNLQRRIHGEAAQVFLRFRSLGPFEVHVNGKSVPDAMWKSPKYKFVLAYLVASPGQKYTEDELIEEFWPEHGTSAKNSVYSATSTLRRCLRLDGDNAQEYIVREGDRLHFNPTVPIWHDLHEFEKASADIQAATSGSVERASQVAGLVNGPYLQGCYLNFALRRRQQVDELAVRLFTRLAQETREKRPQDALDFAQRGLDFEPTAQECHLLRMQAFLKLGQPEKAVKQFQACRETLDKELGIEPLTSLFELYYRCQLALP